MNVEDNKIPEEETDVTNDQQATESDDSRVQYPMDEESCRSIISMFIMFVISLNDKLIGRDFKGDLLSLMGVQKGCKCSHPCNLLGSSDVSLAVNPDIVVVAYANMQWGHFVCPSYCQKRGEHSISISPTKCLGTFQVPVSKGYE